LLSVDVVDLAVEERMTDILHIPGDLADEAIYVV